MAGRTTQYAHPPTNVGADCDLVNLLCMVFTDYGILQFLSTGISMTGLRAEQSVVFGDNRYLAVTAICVNKRALTGEHWIGVNVDTAESLQQLTCLYIHRLRTVKLREQLARSALFYHVSVLAHGRYASKVKRAVHRLQRSRVPPAISPIHHAPIGWQGQRVCFGHRGQRIRWEQHIVLEDQEFILVGGFEHLP